MSAVSYDSFTVGWICASDHELDASRAMLDEELPIPGNLDPKDNNVYQAGRIHDHYVIMASLPKGQYGKTSTPIVVKNMFRSFPSIHFRLMVGIGSGIPDKVDIRLGDVVVSAPRRRHGDVIRYNIGKSQPDGGFEIHGHLMRPPVVLLDAVHQLQDNHALQGSKIPAYIEAGLTKLSKERQQYMYPGFDHDILYEAECKHGKELGCSICSGPNIVERAPRKDWAGTDNLRPQIHYGLIASSDRVVASAKERKELLGLDDILCLETKAAGLIDSFPYLVICGICDYVDVFKRDQWQRYAAMASAAYAKELLGHIPAAKTIDTTKAAQTEATIRYRGKTFAPTTTSYSGQVIQRAPSPKLLYLPDDPWPYILSGNEKALSTMPEELTSASATHDKFRDPPVQDVIHESSVDDYTKFWEDEPDHLSRVEQLILRSRASQKNLDELKHETPMAMKYVEEMFTSSPLPTAVHFHLRTELVDYVLTQFDDVQAMLDVLTLSGDDINAEAMTCSAYCERLWPKDGVRILHELYKAFVKLESRDTDHIVYLPSGAWILQLRITKKKSSSTKFLRIVVEGEKRKLIKIAQQLAWLCTVFRDPTRRALSSSGFSIHQSETPGIFEISTRELRQVTTSSNTCWHHLFKGWVIAHGFPIKPRVNKMVGLELPLRAMVELSGTLGPVLYRGGVVLKGHSTILYPVDEPLHQEDQAEIFSQWHLIQSNPPCHISLSELENKAERWLCQMQDLEILSKARIFLGCYKKVKVHLGTALAHKNIEAAKRKEPKFRHQYSGSSASLSFAKIIGGSLSANFSYPRSSGIPRERGPYEEALVHWSETPVIIYDTYDRRAWMVPALSVILHMVHVWCTYNENKLEAVKRPPYIEPDSNIGLVVREHLIRNYQHHLYKASDGPYHLQKKVEQYCLEFDKISAEDKPKASGLVGWDLVDIVKARNGWPATPNINNLSANWVKLTQERDMIVLLVHGLGEVIVPDPTDQEICLKWKKVPSNRDYLTASIQCLHQFQDLYTNSGIDGGNGRLAGVQHSPKDSFTKCNQRTDGKCDHAEDPSVWLRDQIRYTTPEHEGAVVFGTHKLRKLQTLDSERGCDTLSVGSSSRSGQGEADTRSWYGHEFA